MTDRPTANHEIIMTRIFAAPRELVYRMWTEPEHFKAWWGPEGFTNQVVALDVRPGGVWHIDMQGPDGTVYPCRGVYQEVTLNEKLVYTDEVNQNAPEWGDKPPPSSVNTVIFEDVEAGRTKLTLRTVVGSVTERSALVRAGFEQGMGQSFERLRAHLESL